MFRGFSFDAAPRSAGRVYEADCAAMNLSPTSKARGDLQNVDCPVAPLPCSMSELAAQLDQQSLRVDPAFATRASTPPLQDCPSTHAHDSPQPTYSRIATSLLRMQRQSNSRLQCSASHIRDISALVRMIDDQEQCTLLDPAKSRTGSASSTSSTESAVTVSSSDEETLDMEPSFPLRNIEAMVAMQTWRAGERGDRCARVAKTVRMRRRPGNGVVKRRSS